MMGFCYKVTGTRPHFGKMLKRVFNIFPRNVRPDTDDAKRKGFPRSYTRFCLSTPPQDIERLKFERREYQREIRDINAYLLNVI